MSTPPVTPGTHAGLRRFILRESDPAWAWMGPAPRAVAFGAVTLGGLLFSAAPMLGLPAFWSFAITMAVMPGLAGLLLSRSGRNRLLRWTVGLAGVKRAAVRAAQEIDDWRPLPDLPDGALVSVLGRVRGRALLPHRIDGRDCVGLSVPCRAVRQEVVVQGRRSLLRQAFGLQGYKVVGRTHAALFEVLQDFDLVGEDGSILPILAADARMLARPNVRFLGDDREEYLFVGSLDLPIGVTPYRHGVFALREGDPVWVIGFKTFIVDTNAPAGFGRQPPRTPALASSSRLPLLILPAQQVSEGSSTTT